MSGEVLMFPHCGHNPQDTADQEAVLGLEARITAKNGPPRIKLVPPQSKSQISPEQTEPARSSGGLPAIPMAGGRSTPRGRRRLFPNHHSPRRRP